MILGVESASKGPLFEGPALALLEGIVLLEGAALAFLEGAALMFLEGPVLAVFETTGLFIGGWLGGSPDCASLELDRVTRGASGAMVTRGMMTTGKKVSTYSTQGEDIGSASKTDARVNVIETTTDARVNAVVNKGRDTRVNSPLLANTRERYVKSKWKILTSWN